MQHTRKLQNWLSTWINLYTDTGLPRSFAMWTGISVIAGMLQDNVVLKEHNSKLKPNLYVWLLGPPTAGKSESALPGIDLLRLMPFMEIYDGGLTSTFLFQYMESIQQKRAVHNPTLVNPRVYIYSDELAQTLKHGPLAEQLMCDLNVMYNRSTKYGTAAHGLKDIVDPVINWLACCSPSWLKRCVPKDMLDNGFVSRVVTVYEPLKERRRKGVSADPQVWADLTHDLLLISQLKGEFRLTPEAQAARDRWAEKQFQARLLFDELTQHIYGREEEHALKVAMCLTVSSTDDLVITERAFINATMHVLNARASSIDVLRSIAMTPLVEIKAYLLQCIRNMAPVAHSALRNKTWQKIDDNNQFHRLVNSLVAEGQIVLLPSQNGAGAVYDIPRSTNQP